MAAFLTIESKVEVDIYNWRFIVDINRDHTFPINQVQVCEIDFCNYIISPMTIQKLYRISQRKKDEIKIDKVEYIGNSLSCPQCNGLGYIDWVSKVTSPKNAFAFINNDKLEKIIFSFRRNKATSITRVNIKLRGLIYTAYLAKSVKPKGSETCIFCCGSGTNILSLKTSQPEEIPPSKIPSFLA